MAEKALTDVECRWIAINARERAPRTEYVTTTVKGEPVYQYDGVTTRNAKFGNPVIQVARWRRAIRDKKKLREVVRLVLKTYYDLTGRDFETDLYSRPRTVGKVFLAHAKRLEKQTA
jgi:hypothetical protein